MSGHVVPISEFILRLLVGGLLGSAVGFERQWRQRGAGLHTSALVATGASLFALLGPVLGAESETRILANIVTGVGFLAGGVILRQGATVTGLNTAATIWATAAVGALAGVGLFWEAAMGAAAIVLFNLLLQPLAVWIDGEAALFQNRRGTKLYNVFVECAEAADAAARAAIVAFVKTSKLNLHAISTEETADGDRIRADVQLIHRDDSILERMTGALTEVPGVTRVSWRLAETE